MLGWFRRKGTRRWFDPLAAAIAIGCLVIVALVAGSDNPVIPILLVPVGGVLVTALVRSLARRPQLSLAAEWTGSKTTARQSGERIVSEARIILFLRNMERAGEARHCKVEMVSKPSLSPGSRKNCIVRQVRAGVRTRISPYAWLTPGCNGALRGPPRNPVVPGRAMGPRFSQLPPKGCSRARAIHASIPSLSSGLVCSSLSHPSRLTAAIKLGNRLGP
jgi:hypothetical protein